MKLSLGTILGILTIVSVIGGAAMSIQSDRSKIEVLEKENSKLLEKADYFSMQVEEHGWWISSIQQDLKELKSRRDKRGNE